MKLLFVILFLFYYSFSFSQSTINGNIKNESGIPMELVTIKMSSDLTANQMTLSDSLGNYYFKNVKNGDCELITSIIGYTSSRTKTHIIRDTIINFILQPDTIYLNAVTIKSQNRQIQAKSDRLIINIGGSIETKGKTTEDILKQLPTINISDEALKMAGKSSVLVYINDNIVRLNGQTLLSYLNSLPTDDIKSIEIISTPPAQYDAESNVGIVKIVTKKNFRPGWKEYFQAGTKQSSYLSYMASAYVNYVGKKFYFESTIQGWNGTYLNQSQYYNYFPNQTTTTFNPKKWKEVSSDILATLGYNFSANSKIVVSFQVPLFSKQTITDIKNQTDFINPLNLVTDSTIFSNGETSTKNYTYNAEIFFKHSFPNKISYFTGNAAFLNNNVNNNRTFMSISQIGNTNSEPEQYSTFGDQHYKIYTSQIDFVFPLFTCMLNSGAKLSFINTTSNSSFFNIINENSIPVPSLTNEYSYAEKIQAAYSSIEKSINNWSFKGGLRVEMAQTIGTSFENNQSHNNEYTNLFPSIYISHELNHKSNLSLSYAKRINRPPFEFLDPFKWYIGKHDYATGNPFLQPSIVRNLELTYLFNSTFNTKLYYSNEINKFGRYVVLDSSNIIDQIQETDNFLNVQSYGLYIYKSFHQLAWLESEMNTDLNYSKYLSNRKEFADTYGFGGTFTLNNTIFFNKNKTLQGILNIADNVPGIYNYRNKKNFFQMDIGFRCVIPKRRLELRLIATDIFKTASPQYYYKSNNIKQVYQNYYDTRGVKLVLSYKLGNWFIKTSNVPSPSNTEEKQRL